MNLATHVLIGMGAFARDGRSALIAAGIGGVAPDLPTIALELWATVIGGHTPTEIYRNLYFSLTWQAVLAPGHSFLVWGVVLGAARRGRSPPMQAGARAGLLHPACDLPLHAVTPHRHFWPLGLWVYRQPPRPRSQRFSPRWLRSGSPSGSRPPSTSPFPELPMANERAIPRRPALPRNPDGRVTGRADPRVTR